MPKVARPAPLGRTAPGVPGGSAESRLRCGPRRARPWEAPTVERRARRLPRGGRGDGLPSGGRQCHDPGRRGGHRATDWTGARGRACRLPPRGLAGRGKQSAALSHWPRGAGAGATRAWIGQASWEPHAPPHLPRTWGLRHPHLTGPRVHPQGLGSSQRVRSRAKRGHGRTRPFLRTMPQAPRLNPRAICVPRRPLQTLPPGVLREDAPEAECWDNGWPVFSERPVAGALLKTFCGLVFGRPGREGRRDQDSDRRGSRRRFQDLPWSPHMRWHGQGDPGGQPFA